MENELISRQSAIDAIPQQIKGLGGESWMMTYRRSGYNDCVDACLDAIRNLPSVQPEYEPVTAEDFAKTMSETTFYGFMVWYRGALTLMEGQGFVICKKT